MKKYLLIILSLLFTTCTSFAPLSDTQKSDYSTTGFLNDDCLQIVITGQVMTNSQSLILRRRSSSINAINIMYDTIYNYITSYIKQTYSSKYKPEQISALLNSEKISSKINNIIKKGNIEFQFFNNKNQKIIIYRICDRSLKMTISKILD